LVVIAETEDDLIKRLNDPISHFSTIHPPERPTDRSTDGISDKSVPTTTYALLNI